MRTLSTVFWLGTKELRSFFHDPVFVFLVLWAFTFAVYTQAQSSSQELHNGAVGFVDEDNSELSRRIIGALLPPYFKPPERVQERDITRLLDVGRFTFVLDIPPHFERDVLAGRQPSVQVNIDATAMVQAGLGAGYLQQILATEVGNFVTRTEGDFLSRSQGIPRSPVTLALRLAYNPNATTAWFTSVKSRVSPWVTRMTGPGTAPPKVHA